MLTNVSTNGKLASLQTSHIREARLFKRLFFFAAKLWSSVYHMLSVEMRETVMAIYTKSLQNRVDVQDDDIVEIEYSMPDRSRKALEDARKALEKVKKAVSN